MKNTEIFQDYDMVVSITEKTLNDQLLHLLKIGVIHDKFTVVQNIVQSPTPHYTYDVYENDTHLPSDKAYIDGEILPQVRIDESGTNITFILEFIGGSAQLWKGNGPLASLAKFDDINGWKYGVVMNMNLAELENVDTQKGVKMPPDLKAQLSAFQNSMFTVNHLFMDFENTNLVRFDPSVTSVNGEGDEVMNAFVLLMVSYLKYIVANGNPYVLGYALSTGDDTRYDDKHKVPDDLKPVGTTYTMYKDPVHQELSNLNFVLATKGGNGPEGISGSPGVFDSNWIGVHEQCDAKMVYSHSRLIEAFILEPFYKQFKDKVYKHIKDNVTVSKGASYSAGKKKTTTGYAYTISNHTTGHDHYVNKYTADFINQPGKLRINLKGSVSVYVKKTKDMGICTAEAEASGAVGWSGTVDLISSKDAKGNPTISIDHDFDVKSPRTSSSKNGCAKAWKIIGQILGAILSIFSMGITAPFFIKLFGDLLDTKIPGIGNLSLAMGSLGASVSTAVILPAGQVFFFKNVAGDAEGNLNLELTYKSETG